MPLQGKHWAPPCKAKMSAPPGSGNPFHPAGSPDEIILLRKMKEAGLWPVPGDCHRYLPQPVAACTLGGAAFILHSYPYL